MIADGAKTPKKCQEHVFQESFGMSTEINGNSIGS